MARGEAWRYWRGKCQESATTAPRGTRATRDLRRPHNGTPLHVCPACTHARTHANSYVVRYDFCCFVNGSNLWVIFFYLFFCFCPSPLSTAFKSYCFVSSSMCFFPIFLFAFVRPLSVSILHIFISSSKCDWFLSFSFILPSFVLSSFLPLFPPSFHSFYLL